MYPHTLESGAKTLIVPLTIVSCEMRIAQSEFLSVPSYNTSYNVPKMFSEIEWIWWWQYKTVKSSCFSKPFSNNPYGRTLPAKRCIHHKRLLPWRNISHLQWCTYQTTFHMNDRTQNMSDFGSTWRIDTVLGRWSYKCLSSLVNSQVFIL